jgi:hypothetical protein
MKAAKVFTFVVMLNLQGTPDINLRIAFQGIYSIESADTAILPEDRSDINQDTEVNATDLSMLLEDWKVGPLNPPAPLLPQGAKGEALIVCSLSPLPCVGEGTTGVRGIERLWGVQLPRKVPPRSTTPGRAGAGGRRDAPATPIAERTLPP